MMIALAVHCTADGIAMAAGREAYASKLAHGRVLDLSMVMAICVHKVPEGLALGALLLGAGLSSGGVMLWVLAVESTTVLGGVIGLFLLPHVSPACLDAVVAGPVHGI